MADRSHGFSRDAAGQGCSEIATGDEGIASNEKDRHKRFTAGVRATIIREGENHRCKKRRFDARRMLWGGFKVVIDT
jgi:uncharacterized protein YbaA (DUF1428 family)